MQPETLNIGLIEDDEVMGGSIVQRLELEGCTVRWWLNGGDALLASGDAFGNLDLVLCDIRLPDMDGETLYRGLIGSKALPPFIFITGFGEIDQAVRLMRLGAVDYVTKPFDFEQFLERIRAHARIHAPSGRGGGGLGLSPQMREVETVLGRYARTDLPVLITGETGAGKEVAARYLHGLAMDADQPFMAVNCAAIPGELLESEIFGHEKGAFTGATNRHLGYAERAGSGILFLDEIGDMPPGLQAKILRLIEDRSIHRIGGEKAVPFKARIVAATHRDLTSKTGGLAFREDLYFRIAVLPVHVPPLRERFQDIMCLIRMFVAEASARQDKDFRGISSLVEEIALAHSWPGNVRELRNRVERAVALATGEWLMPGDLFPDLHGASLADGNGDFLPLAEIRAAAERRQIERALAKTSGQVQAAARLLEVSRTTLWDKMTRLGIRAERPAS